MCVYVCVYECMCMCVYMNVCVWVWVCAYMSVGGLCVCVSKKYTKHKTQRTCIMDMNDMCVFTWTKQKQTTQRTRIISEGGVVPVNRGYDFFCLFKKQTQKNVHA